LPSVRNLTLSQDESSDSKDAYGGMDENEEDGCMKEEDYDESSEFSDEESRSEAEFVDLVSDEGEFTGISTRELPVKERE